MNEFIHVSISAFERLPRRYRLFYINLLYHCKQAEEGIYVCDTSRLRAIAGIFDISTIECRLKYLSGHGFICVTSKLVKVKRRRKKIWYIQVIPQETKQEEQTA